MTGYCRYTVPKELTWPQVMVGSRSIERLGFGNEWEVREDAGGNRFYRHLKLGTCEWDQPVDALKVQAADRLCTAYQVNPAMG